MSQSLKDKAKAYQRQKQLLTVFHLFLTPVILLSMVVFKFTVHWEYTARQITRGGDYVALAVYFLFLSLYMLIFDVPFSYYTGFVLEHRFDLSNQSFEQWFTEWLKKSLLSFAVSLAFLEGLYFLIWSFPARWWLCAWAGYAMVSYFFGKIFPVWIVPLFYKYDEIRGGSVRERILNLAARYGMPVKNVYSLNLSKTTKKANAAFMGIGKTRRVVLSDTLLENFSEDEIETVVAHELGHFKHRDILKQLAFGLVTSFLLFWLAFRLVNPVANYLRLNNVYTISTMPVLFLVFYAFSLILMPVQNGFARWIERAADRFALKAFPYKEVFISCMEKLGRVNLADPDPHPLYEWFFYDHPAISKRIRMAEEWKGK
ncbi:MAG: M48 family metallopeptidase [Candidatus Omnitrophica bacterium]|nr:M48 family metallopeptidase [Candidatus Omnitrophota bacterium]